MSGIAFSLDDRALRRADERRLSAALGASLVIHALMIASLRGILPAIYGFPQPGPGNLPALQAVLEGPKIEPAPEATSESVSMLEPNREEPAAEHPIEVPKREPSPATGPPSGGNPVRSGADTQEVSISVGTIDDPGKLDAEFVARLAARFPQRVSKPPVLSGTPVLSYPQAALEAGAQRRVSAIVIVRADGTIDEAQLAHDDPLFGPAVLEALKGARFAPAEIDGSAVPYWAIVEFVFLIGRPAAAPLAQRGAPRRSFVFPRQPAAGP